MTQFQPQTPRNGLSPLLRFVAGAVFSLACLLLLLPGAAEAKGGGSRGGSGGRSYASRGSSATQRRQHPPVQYKHKHKHKKHKDKNDGDGDMDGGDEADGGDAGDAEAPEAPEAAEAGEAEVAPVAVYGMEITGLYKGAAAKAGLGLGTIIMKVNGTPTPTFEALSQALAQSGGRARVEVIRDGDETETVTLYPQNGLIGVSVEPARVE